MSAHLYVEGSNKDSKEAQVRCREGFRKLLEKMELAGRMPRLIACGSRENAFRSFKTAHASRKAGDYVALLVDSEAKVKDRERTWDHLKESDDWDRPDTATDEQALLMTTCMETWIVADRSALRKHYGQRLQESALPPLVGLENREPHQVHDQLTHATRSCANAYKKGKRSFEVLEKLDPKALKQHLPGFERIDRILQENLAGAGPSGCKE